MIALFNNRVLFYNGQLDAVISIPLIENFIRALKWSGAEEYARTTKKIWYIVFSFKKKYNPKFFLALLGK